jgi:Tfp pilus assembly PilM family ATPase
MAPKEQTICGIEIGKEVVCLVQYLPEASTVTSVALQPIEDISKDWWDSVREQFKSMATTMKLGGQDANCSFPAENAVIKRLMLDKEDNSPDDAIQWELGQQIIGSLEEYVYDFQLVRMHNTDSQGNYLVVACRSKAVDRISALMKSYKLNPVVIDLDVCALVNVFEANYRENISFPSLLVLGGEEYTKIVLTCDGGLVDFECFKHTAAHRQGPAYAQAIKDALQKLLSLNAAFAGQKTPSVYFTGQAFTQEELCSQCLSSIDNSEILLPFRKISCKAIGQEDLRKYSPQLAVAVGLALQGNPVL